MIKFPSHRMSRLLGTSVLALALAACTVGPDYQPPAPEARAGWQGQQQQADFAQIQQWWAAFHDSELDSLVARAIAGNLDVKMAEQRIIEARAQKSVAESAYYPTVSSSGGASRAHVPRDLVTLPGGSNSVNFYDLDASMSWEVDLFGKTKRNVEAAEANVGASIEERRGALVSLLGELGNDYAQLRAAQLRLAIAKRNVDAESELLGLTRSKFDVHLGSELDVAQSEAQLANVRAVIPQLESSVIQQGNAIAVLLGLEPGTLTDELNQPGALPPAPPMLPAAMPSDVVRNRPDIRSAERQMAAANAQIGVADAARYPSLTLSPQAALTGSTIHQMFSSAGLLWAAAASVKQPIYEGGKLDANIRSAEASAEEARLNYKKTVLTAFREVEDALVGYQSEQRRHQELTTARDASRRALDRATELYKAGLGDFLNVLDGERNLYSAEDNLAQSEQTLTQQTVSLYKALGAGWQAGEQASAS